MQQTFFDKFHVQKRISFGAFSAVYLVNDEETDESVALKIEKKESNNLLEYEYSIGKSLFARENIINIYDFFEDEKNRGVSMELIFDVLSNIRNKRRNPPPIPLILSVARNSFNGLRQLHERGILHHDVKPSNLGVRTDGKNYEIVLFDFGLSQSSDEPAHITEFRDKLDQNPRYFPLANHVENANVAPWSEKKRCGFNGILHCRLLEWFIAMGRQNVIKINI
jgi:serine/threonine protein kinase